VIRLVLLTQALHDHHIHLKNIPPACFFLIAKDNTKKIRKRAWYRLKIFLKYFFKRTAKEPVFVIAKRRSGSNLLLSYLNSVPDLSFWPPEPLNWRMYYGVRKNRVSKKAVLRHLAYTLNSARTPKFAVLKCFFSALSGIV